MIQCTTHIAIHNIAIRVSPAHYDTLGRLFTSFGIFQQYCPLPQATSLSPGPQSLNATQYMTPFTHQTLLLFVIERNFPSRCCSVIFRPFWLTSDCFVLFSDTYRFFVPLSLWTMNYPFVQAWGGVIGSPLGLSLVTQ